MSYSTVNINYTSTTSAIYADRDTTGTTYYYNRDGYVVERVERAPFRDLDDYLNSRNQKYWHSIEYDPKEKRFEVTINDGGWGVRYFDTKRSAKRFVERWIAKKKGQVVKKDIVKLYKAEAKRKKEEIEEQKRRLELAKHLAKLQREREEANEIDDYFWRLGTCG